MIEGLARAGEADRQVRFPTFGDVVLAVEDFAAGGLGLPRGVLVDAGLLNRARGLSRAEEVGQRPLPTSDGGES